MVPEPDHAQLTPLVFDQAAPGPVKLEIRFTDAPSTVKLHLEATNADLTLTPDASGKVFTAMLPAAAYNGLTAADVNRKFLGHLFVTLGNEKSQLNMFGDVLTAAIPAVTVQPVNADVQFSEHVVNIRFPALADTADQVGQQVSAICQKFYAHFDDDYDFLQVVFARANFANRHHFATRADAQGIGTSPPNVSAQYGSAGRLMGITVFPIATMFDAGAPTASHELGHQWINFLGFAPLQAGVPHWPLSDLASDLMGFSLPGDKAGGHFNYDLQPLGGGNYKMVPNNSPKGFSDLSLYLMGMVPANQVGSHFVFDNQQQQIVANGTLAGPVTSVSVNDVIAHFGARVPAAASAQKRFRIATILVTKGALAPVETMRLYDFFAARARAKTELAYSDGFAQATGKPFRLATNGIGRLDPRIKRRILIDASRDGGVWWFPQHAPFAPDAPHQGKALADHFKSLRHTVKELIPGTPITPALLAGFDIVIRVAGKGAYTAAEIAAYDAWVKDFGSLLLLAEHHPQDALASHFGLTFKSMVRGQQMLSTFTPHPITSGVGPIPYPGGSGVTAQPASAKILGKLSAASFLDLNDSGVKDANEPSAPAGLGVMPFGQGRIVFCGDVNLWETVPQPLVKNTLRWFASP